MALCRVGCDRQRGQRTIVLMVALIESASSARVTQDSADSTPIACKRSIPERKRLGVSVAGAPTLGEVCFQSGCCWQLVFFGYLQLLEVRGPICLALAVSDHDAPAFTCPNPRLRDNDQTAFAFDLDPFVLAFSYHPIGQFCIPVSQPHVPTQLTDLGGVPAWLGPASAASVTALAGNLVASADLIPYLFRSPTMAVLRDQNRPGFRYHLKVHSFRTFTVILAWAIVVLAFYEKPELLTDAQRLLQRGIENVGDAIPPPWGPRVEFVFREIGGLIWLQITLIVIGLRIALSAIAAMLRFFGLRG